MEVCNDLKILADSMHSRGHNLYIVGGYVRDSLLGFQPGDIDVASSMPYLEVIEVCKKLKFKSNIVNKNLGTIAIITKNNTFEYTQFRIESYSVEGGHTPAQVEFTHDIKVDAVRRDISINSIYYDIVNNEIIDPVCGKKDLYKNIIRTSNNPDFTLNDDGLRILRLIRFASIYNFKFHNKTYYALKNFSGRLKNISKQRILAELKLLVVSDLKLTRPNTIFLKSLNNIRLLEFIFNHSLSRLNKLTKKEINMFYTFSHDARLLGFYLLIIKKYLQAFSNSNQLTFVINMLLGRDGIMESKKTIKLIEKMFRIYQNTQYNKDAINASVNYLTLESHEKEVVLALLDKKAKHLLTDKIAYIEDKNLPLSVHELDITATDLIDAGIDKNILSKILSTLYNQVMELRVENKKDKLIEYAKDICEQLEQINSDINNQLNT